MRLIDADALIDDLEGVCLYDPAMARNAIKRVIRRQPTIEPDTDTISRQDAIEHLKKRLYESALNNEGVVSETMEEIADNRIQIWMDELPPSPSKPHWIRMPMFDHGFTGDYCFQCSECKSLTEKLGDHCPKCGADMRN